MTGEEAVSISEATERLQSELGAARRLAEQNLQRFQACERKNQEITSELALANSRIQQILSTVSEQGKSGSFLYDTAILWHGKMKELEAKK